MPRLEEPLVTICIPSIGRMEFLPQLRQSVESQTYACHEILILENECAKPAQLFFKQWEDEDARVKRYPATPRLPMFQNFDRGLSLASTPYVTFFHDDDVYSTYFLERAVSELEKNPTAGFWGSNYDFIDSDGKLTQTRRWIKKTERWAGDTYIEALLSRGRNVVPMPGIVFRREALKSGFSGLNPHFGDFYFLMHLAETWDVCVCIEPLISIRKHDAQASNSFSMAQNMLMRTVMFDHYLKDLVLRCPEKKDFADQMKKYVEWGHRITLIWAWLSASTPSEAKTCQEAIAERGGSPLLLRCDRMMADLMGRLDFFRGSQTTKLGVATLYKWAKRLGF